MSNDKKPVGPVSLDDIIAASSPAERLVSVCVDGSLVAEHQQLEQELADAQHTDLTGGGRLGQAPSAPAVAKRIQDLEKRMRDHTFIFRFRAISARAWSDLMAKHPDPTGKKVVNEEAFAPAAIAASCVEPTGMDDPEKLDKLLSALSAAQVDDLFGGAWGANTSAPSVPFSYAASAVLRSFETSSPTARLSESRAPSSSAE